MTDHIHQLSETLSLLYVVFVFFLSNAVVLSPICISVLIWPSFDLYEYSFVGRKPVFGVYDRL